MRGSVALLCLALIGVYSRVVRADEQRIEAERLFQRAQVHFVEGEYDRAIELFERSYLLSKEPLLVYDLAQSHRLKGDCEAALHQYRRYLRLTEDPTPGSPGEDTRRVARDHASELEHRCGQPVKTGPQEPAGRELEAAKAMPLPPAGSTQNRWNRISALPLVLAIVGGGALGTGLYYLAVDGREQCTPGETSPCVFRRDTARYGWGFFAGGALLLTSAATVAVFETRAAPAIAIGVGSASLQIGGRF